MVQMVVPLLITSVENEQFLLKMSVSVSVVVSNSSDTYHIWSLLVDSFSGDSEKITLVEMLKI
jgi:hypothetical protein